MKKMKTLVVGDDPASNKLLKVWLESQTNKVILADDGQEALERLQENSVDLIVTDAKMPRLDGFTLILRIRNTEKLKHIPIILYSAFYHTDGYEKLAMKNGADKFIRKDGDIHGVVSAVAEYLNTN